MTIGSNTVASDQLRQHIERIERLEAEKAEIVADIRELYKAAKGEGFDPKIMRKVIAERKMEADKRQEQEYILDTYRHALGMLADTPLGQHAMVRAEEGPTL